MNMNKWLEDLKQTEKKLSMPVLSFPGIQLTGASVLDVVKNGESQAACMTAIARRYNTLAAVSNMDLSVEAEAFGATAAFYEDEVPSITGHIIEDGADAAALKVPPVGAGRTGEYVRAIEIASTEINDRPIFAGVIGPFSLAGRLTEMTEIMYLAVDEPEAVHELLAKATAFLIDYICAFKNAGANGIVMAEPAAGLLSPDWNSEFSADYVRQIVEAVQDDEFIVIYHNCGTVIPLMSDIISTGAKALHFGNTTDMAEAINLIPEDILVMGNIDPVAEITHGDDQSIQEAVTELEKKMAGRKNFVLSTGCDIPPHAPIANLDAFFAAASR